MSNLWCSATELPERRSRFRGSAQFDLCNLLETIRRNEQLSAIALADTSGLVVAGAGRYRDCEELSAQAAGDAEVCSATVEIPLDGQRLLLRAAREQLTRVDLSAETADAIAFACQRILTHGRTKPAEPLLDS